MFGALGSLFQTLQGHPVVSQADSGLFHETFDEPIDDSLVEVFSSQVGVAGGRENFEKPVLEFEDGDVERAAAEIVDRDALVLLVLESVRQRGGGGLIDDAENIQSRDLAGIARGLALTIVEIRRNSNDGF